MAAVKSPPLVALTLGDPAGIGPEIVHRTLRDRRLPKGFRYEVVGTETGRGIQSGRRSAASARAALTALNLATRGCLEGRFAAMVTAPVCKESVAKLQPDFVGQTEFLARACGLPDEAAVMTLTDPKLTVALCSNHCSIREALRRLKPQRIVQVTRIVRRFLIDSGIREPRLAVAGINPHGGENGLFGDDDQRLVAPAIELLAREKITLATGPADTLFYRAVVEKAFDAVVCAYHDQGLIPFKLAAFRTGVNVTLGLPLIRTSPDHGTAFELAGRGVARHDSMLAAVRLACRLALAKNSAKNRS